MMIEALVTCTLQSGFYYTIIIKQDKVNEALTLRPENLVYNTSNRSNIQHHELYPLFLIIGIPHQKDV